MGKRKRTTTSSGKRSRRRQHGDNTPTNATKDMNSQARRRTDSNWYRCKDTNEDSAATPPPTPAAAAAAAAAKNDVSSRSEKLLPSFSMLEVLMVLSGSSEVAG